MRVIGTEEFLFYVDLDKTFHLYADASDHQLGAVMMQDREVLAICPQKLNKAQNQFV
jgi:hypothetical protein